jgi:hypothetical protein
MTARYTRDSKGIGDMLNSDMIRSAMEIVANEIKVRAEIAAPVYRDEASLARSRARREQQKEVKKEVQKEVPREVAPRKGVQPRGTGEKHMPGRYKASFHVKSQLNGGATRDRAEAIVYNDSPEAIYVEFGHRGREPYHILASAAFRPLKGMA